MVRSIYELRDAILRGGRLVLPLAQLATVSGVPKGSAKVYAARLVKRGLARRLVEGVISLADDSFIIATQLVEPSYISFTGALYLNGLTGQVPNLVECVTTRNTRKFESLGLCYRRIHPSLFFGYQRVERGGSYVFIAEPEKSLLDMVYFGRLYPSISARVLRRVDQQKLKSYAGRFGEAGGYRARKVTDWVKGHVG